MFSSIKLFRYGSFSTSLFGDRRYCIDYHCQTPGYIRTYQPAVAIFAFFPEAPLVVYCKYGLMTCAHAIKTVESLTSGSWEETIKHFFATCISAAFISMMQTGIYPTRWHHMSYDLLTLLPCFSTLIFFWRVYGY